MSDPQLAKALNRTRDGLVGKRERALKPMRNFPAIRAAAASVRQHALNHLEFYLQRFEQRFEANGGRVHWAENSADACRIVQSLLTRRDHQRVIKGKSMVSEEIGLNAWLEGAGMEVLETDLGEYIVQLAKETPSHIIAPAVHKTREQIDALFAHHHGRETVPAVEIEALVAEARARLRKAFLSADAGITGANALIAETGSVLLVTNEGNGDLSACMPDSHIVVTSIEKVVPGLDDAGALLRVLGRSATGQAMSAYTTLFHGPASEQQTLDLVLVDNRRSEILAGPYKDILRCIRCGACLNHCPIYSQVGGHAYGWVYTGPMGAVLTPLLSDFEQSGHLPAASTLCGRCNEVCPVDIQIPEMLRRLRDDEAQRAGKGSGGRVWLRLLGWLGRYPRLYGGVTRVARFFLRRSSGPWASKLPGTGAWRKGRPLARPGRGSQRGE